MRKRTRINNKSTALLVALAVALAVPACGDDDETSDNHHHVDDGGIDLDEEGCEHLEGGPFVTVTAGADQASAAEVKADHHAYTITLTADQAGFVKFAADAAGDHVVFLDADVPFAVEGSGGTRLTIEESLTTIGACTTVKGKHTFELPAVGLYFFQLGPTATAEVKLVIEEAGHGHQH